MARQIATQERISEAAEELVAAGLDPSVIAIQKRTGGSFSTVSKGRDVWRKEQAEKATAAASRQAPPEVDFTALEFGRAMWGHALDLARKEFQLAKEEAVARERAATSALSEAEAEISRLEESERKHEHLIDVRDDRIRNLEMALLEEQIGNRRVAELETLLKACNKGLDVTRIEARDAVVALAGVRGEADAMRTQIHELMAKVEVATPSGHSQASLTPRRAGTEPNIHAVPLGEAK